MPKHCRVCQSRRSILNIQLKRVYEAPSASDGTRVLVERLWPRGLSKDRAKIDVWMRDVAPTPALRRWYQHEPSKWAEFRRRYRAELKANVDQIRDLKKTIGRKKVTFVFASKEEKKNSASVLKVFLESGNAVREGSQ